jgi:hypothetical protein
MTPGSFGLVVSFFGSDPFALAFPPSFQVCCAKPFRSGYYWARANAADASAVFTKLMDVLA